LDTEKTEHTERASLDTRRKFTGKHSELTGEIIGCFFQVHKELGYGFSEKVYENALSIALRESRMKVDQQVH
jgi:hypothetical protein